MDKLQETIYEAAESGGAVLRHYFKNKLPEIKFKADKSLVTTADLESEKAIISVLRNKFPDYAIESEEQGETSARNSSLYKWLVDPLDGTENFVTGIAYFSISIAVSFNGIPQAGLIYNPITEEFYFAKKGEGVWLNNQPITVSNKTKLNESKILIIPDVNTKKSAKAIKLRENIYLKTRRLLDTWSPALDWCLVASGRADALITMSSKDVSANAGTLILEEAGGKLTDFDGNPFKGGYLLASNTTQLHNELLKVIGSSFSEN